MRMSDDALLAQIELLERQAVGYWSGEIASEQSKAMDYYLSKPFGTEEEGRSQVVSSDVWDVVEGMTPAVLKPFVSSDDLVRFNALGPDDEDAAQQETDYINWVVTQRNDSFNALVAWVKTGLLQKNGVVKYWWEKSTSASIERYFGVADDVFAALAQDAGVEIVEHTETSIDGQEPTHDVTLRVTEEVGRARYAVLAPEEFLISRDASTPNPQEALFVQHRKMVTIGELREMGYDVPDTLAEGDSLSTDMSAQYLARRNGEESGIGDDEGNDPTMRRVLFRETYMRVDADGDGKPELRKVCAVGREILANEETEEIPFCAWTPYMQPFKFYGRCPADETLEIQLVKSTLWRQSLDNIYTINNNRVFANEDVNLDDLIDNQIAGVVRVKGTAPVGSSVFPAPITPIGGVVQPMIEYLDSAKENRTGFTRYNQGSDANDLNKTATGIRLIKESANGRIEIISRAFAEQGLAPLMRGVHGLCRRHATKAETIRLRGEWVSVDPRAWKKRSDLSVRVGLGTSDQQMRMAGVQMLMQQQKELIQVPGLVTPENLYNSAAKFSETMGYKNPEAYFTKPQQQEQTLPPQVKQVLEQAQSEIQQLQQALQEAQGGLAKAKIDAEAKVSAEQVKAAAQQALQAQSQQFDAFLQKLKDEAAYDRQELAAAASLMSKQIQPPQVLAASVAEDITEENDGQA